MNPDQKYEKCQCGKTIGFFHKACHQAKPDTLSGHTTENNKPLTMQMITEKLSGEKLKGQIAEALHPQPPLKEENHCSGCTEADPWDLPEGRTHQMETIEHPGTVPPAEKEKEVCVIDNVSEIHTKDCTGHTPELPESWEEEFENYFARYLRIKMEGECILCERCLSAIKSFIAAKKKEWEDSLLSELREKVDEKEIGVKWIDGKRYIEISALLSELDKMSK